MQKQFIRFKYTFFLLFLFFSLSNLFMFFVSLLFKYKLTKCFDIVFGNIDNKKIDLWKNHLISNF